MGRIDPLSPYGFTVVEAPEGTVLTKTLTPDAVLPYDNSYLHRFHPRVLPPDCAAWYDYLAKIAPLPNVAIIRAAPVEGLPVSKTDWHRRLEKPKADAAATLRAVPRAWVGLDWDAVAEPEGMDWRTDPRAAAEAAVLAQVPDWLRDADFVVGYTSSHGFKDGMRLRSFHLLECPLDRQQLTQLFASTKADPATFRDVQLHYTAAPIFAGVDDPLPGNRLHLVRRSDRLATVPPLPARGVSAPTVAVSGVSAARVSRNARPLSVAGYAGKIEAHFATMFEVKDGGRGFYAPAQSIIGLFYAVNPPDADPAPLLARIERTIRANCDRAAYPKGHVHELMKKLQDFSSTLATRPASSPFGAVPENTSEE